MTGADRSTATTSGTPEKRSLEDAVAAGESILVNAVASDQRREGGRARLSRIAEVLNTHDLDALICSMPSNILMLSGYWPVVGTSVALATREGSVTVLVPEDEEELAGMSWAESIRTYKPGNLQEQLETLRAVLPALGSILARAGIGTAGYETLPLYEGSSYSATFRMQAHIAELLTTAYPPARLVPADDAIRDLRFALTPFEVDRVRCSGHLAAEAFDAARAAMAEGTTEADVASACTSSFEREAFSREGVIRGGAFAWCMSGENSAKAGGAFARTTGRRLQEGDLVLVHCNPYIDGYFGDVTRTYVLGEPDTAIRAMFGAVFMARGAALSTLRPGVRCRDVDRAARSVLESRGYGDYFTHGVGHSVGFSVISAELPPRLNPTSPDVLEIGCTVNIEPAIYREGLAGIRHCDVVTITESGYELLTGFEGERLTVDTFYVPSDR